MFKQAALALGMLAALFLASPAKAQWHDNLSCNQANTSGFERYAANGPFKVRYYISWHYQASDPEAVRSEIVKVFTAEMNYYERTNGSDVRFQGVDWSATPDQGLNFTIYIDAYSTADGYRMYADVHGWGVDHLFRTSSALNQDAGAAVLDVANEVADRMSKGWVCNN